MKSIITSFTILACSLSSSAQFYYKDIIGTADVNRMIHLYQTNNVKTVTATGFDEDGRKNAEFSETHYFFPERNLLRIATRNNQTVTNQYFRFDKNGLVTSITDTSLSLVSATNYSYDDKSNMVSVRNTVTDASDSIYVNELHQWFYNEAGKPVRMLRVVNRTDTTDVRFTLDENGNVIDEWPFINRISRQKTYYYYNSKNQLTDIVRYNVAARKLLPDFMFEYTDQNQLRQKTTTIGTMGITYLVWTFVYNDKGLKSKEATFKKDKKLGQLEMVGKIEYSYNFGQ
jgi:hypothetical protein